MLRRRTTFVLASLLIMGLGIAACEDEPDDEPDEDAAEILEGLDGADITVGSKEFTEQVVLGQMLVIALEEAGADVTDETSLAGTAVVRESLETEEIDAYWEYTGTAWADIFGEEEIVEDPDELHEMVAERDEEENDIVWGARGDFENSYGIAQNQEIAEEYGVETISELAELSREDPEAASFCVAEEFATRDDGLPGLTEHYDAEWAVPDPFDEGVIYTETADAPDSPCHFGMVFTTDGRIAALDLELVDDDDNFFPEYNPALTVRAEVAEEHPELVELGDEIIASIGFDEMQELNARVDEEGEIAEDVARDHLEEVGIVN
ncbi:glycine/betaine ABC transporter substrate-binding protein [Egibacter rhizosphaerae]|uniref:Glycine/betaine ABC transporter substrate-binding protein n=1 Tax=Egibacter rhizosphaerae TaxID=1670831 RepID=A0A411YJV1_9ACTN|nr:glycine betaine ABC transporter substrate-binding protein [Egibacter rhizosphaerae]QBI21475.1 glycine/betaine ABC transporter substrate-binding protein [Egibacter rhizosphaerae]